MTVLKVCTLRGDFNGLFSDDKLVTGPFLTAKGAPCCFSDFKTFCVQRIMDCLNMVSHVSTILEYSLPNYYVKGESVTIFNIGIGLL